MNATTTDSARAWRWAFAGAPLLAYAVVYALTCLIGAFLALGRFPAFHEALATFSGIRLPPFSHTVVQIDTTLLVGAPLLLALGYLLALACAHRCPPRWRVRAPRVAFDLRLLIFAVFFLYAWYSIAHAGAFARVSDWLDFSAWVEARWALFHSLGFLAFANIYTLVPLLAAWVLLSERRGNKLIDALRWVPSALALGLSLMLFQKKAAVITILIVLVSWLLRNRRTGAGVSRLMRRMSLGVAVVCLVYFTSVVIPTLTAGDGANQAVVFSKERVEATALYAAFAPITRTSIPALYYPYVFPRLHRYYGLDFGQDILGFGTMPDDNRVIWRFMYPGQAGGAMAPFQFVLYSQTGLEGALVGSFVIGALLAALWSLVLQRVLPADLEEMFGALVVVFGINLAIDSVRDSLLVSYGVFWGFALLCALFVFSCMAGAVTEARAAPRAEER